MAYLIDNIYSIFIDRYHYNHMFYYPSTINDYIVFLTINAEEIDTQEIMYTRHDRSLININIKIYYKLQKEKSLENICIYN